MQFREGAGEPAAEILRDAGSYSRSEDRLFTFRAKGIAGHCRFPDLSAQSGVWREAAPPLKRAMKSEALPSHPHRFSSPQPRECEAMPPHHASAIQPLLPSVRRKIRPPLLCVPLNARQRNQLVGERECRRGSIRSAGGARMS
jgi:hypothetical protein